MGRALSFRKPATTKRENDHQPFSIKWREKNFNSLRKQSTILWSSQYHFTNKQLWKWQYLSYRNPSQRFFLNLEKPVCHRKVTGKEEITHLSYFHLLFILQNINREGLMWSKLSFYCCPVNVHTAYGGMIRDRSL